MKIGIDISQTAHEKTGVAQFVIEFVTHLASIDSKNEYILFFSSLRKSVPSTFKTLIKEHANVSIKQYKLPPTMLNVLWNHLHIVPIEWFLGNIDIFISSDWTQPPTKARSVTILYDLIVYKYPQETDSTIVATQKKRLDWVKKECDTILCISESTKKDAEEILKIDKNRLTVVYPGI